MRAPSIDRLPSRPKLVFMGTPEFAIPCLQSLINHGHDITAVVTQPDRPKGRGRQLVASLIKLFAVEHGVEVLQPEKASDKPFCDLIKAREPDLIIVIAFGQILKRSLLTVPKWGAINIHASLLPQYRGAAPIQWAIMNDESKTGLTVMRMDEGLDTGPILFQDEVPILRDETAGQLHDRLASKAGDLIIRSLDQMVKKPVKESPQDHSKATYAPKIEKSMCLIDWKQPAVKISAMIRAMDPKPGAYTPLQGKKIKLFSSSVRDEGRLDVVPGRVVRDGKGILLVETGKGMLEVGEIQYPGKKRLSSHEFLRGFSVPEGTVLGQ